MPVGMVGAPCEDDLSPLAYNWFNVIQALEPNHYSQFSRAWARFVCLFFLFLFLWREDMLAFAGKDGNKEL